MLIILDELISSLVGFVVAIPDVAFSYLFCSSFYNKEHATRACQKLINKKEKLHEFQLKILIEILFTKKWK